MSEHDRINELIDEYAQSTPFSRGTLTDLARDVDDAAAFEWIISAWISGFRMPVDTLLEMYRNASHVSPLP